MKQEFFIGVKNHLLYVFNTLDNNYKMTSIAGLFGALVQFVLKSFYVDFFLVMGLIAMVALNTITGVIKANRPPSTYDPTVLKNSVMQKFTGYFMLLLIVAVFMCVIFVAGHYEGTKILNDYWLNLPVVLLLVFFNAVELKSCLDNATELGWPVPGFIKALPDKTIKKIDEIGNKSDIV